MTKDVNWYLSDAWKAPNGASLSDIQNVEERANFRLPSDYVQIMMEFNGLDGSVGDGGLIMYAIEDLLETNQDFSFLMNDIPDYFLFGQDAAQMLFAFHKSKLTYHTFDRLSYFETDPIEYCGSSFLEFLEYLYSRD